MMKGVLDHISKCTSGLKCKFTYCVSSRHIINHLKNCAKEDCLVCASVKKYAIQQGISSEQRQSFYNRKIYNFF